MKKITSLFLVVLMILNIITLAGCSNGSDKNYNTQYKVCMITDAGDITDHSFNEATYLACKSYCEENNIKFTYKKPNGSGENYFMTAIDIAVAEGYNIIAMSGFVFAPAVATASKKYPEIKIIALDMNEADIVAGVVGNDYYSNADQYNPSDYYNPSNVYTAIYSEEIAGYLVGYLAVKSGYKHLGFLGGQAVAAVKRFGYGYIQGADDAAIENGIASEIMIEYAYGGQFYGSAEITAVMDTWASKGTEIIFACGGSIYTSACESMAKYNGKMIGVDSDQSQIIDRYGDNMTVTSAMKNINATINTVLEAIIKTNTFDQLAGQPHVLGIVSDSDMSLNYVGLPEETTQWSKDFSYEDYKSIVGKIYRGEKKISDDVSKMPSISIKVNERQGTIK